MPQLGMPSFFGQRIIETVQCVKRELVPVKRSWRERLTSLTPWRATRIEERMVPAAYELANGTIIMHPAVARRLKEQCK